VRDKDGDTKMNDLPRRHDPRSPRWLWVGLAAVAIATWLIGGAGIAEALNGWTARLAEMVLVDYPPGYGDTHYETY